MTTVFTDSLHLKQEDLKNSLPKFCAKKIATISLLHVRNYISLQQAQFTPLKNRGVMPPNEEYLHLVIGQYKANYISNNAL